MTGDFMTDDRTNMQNNQNSQDNAGNIMGLFENSNEFCTFNRRGYEENIKDIDRPVHHHAPCHQDQARHQVNALVNPKSRPLCERSLSLFPLRKRKKNPDNKKRNKQCRDGNIKKTYCLLERRRNIKQRHIKAADQRP